uniref:Uncharacterized protein n=2 Tax=Sphaerodactylus townsendi TaxID=933632 RepID=A0ACB8EWG2_9SAUR
MAARLQTPEELANAIRTMQRFAGVPMTGKLDAQTVEMMNRPRCSLPDIIGTSELMRRRRRRRRYALSDTGWKKKDLTWHVRSFPLDSTLPHDHIRNLFFYALKAWSKSSALTFREVHSGDADILVDFSRSYHEDGYPFDGPGGTLAHAFFPGEYPIAGDTHFDDEETWIYDPENKAPDHGTDLFAVAVHEFGHALGLAHSSAKESIMIPYYQGPVGLPHDYRLPLDDAMGIEQIYGKPHPGSRPDDDTPMLPVPTAPPMPDLPPFRPTQHTRPLSPERCKAHFDAIANIRGEMFFFKQKHFWRMQPSRNLVSLEPAQTLTRWFWERVSPNDSQSLYRSRCNVTHERAASNLYLSLIGSYYWVFHETRVTPGYPRPISDLGLPDNTVVGAAFVWPHNGKTYLLEKNQYWRYDDQLGRVESGYPKSVSLWEGVPTDLDDVTRWNDGKTYFFKGTQYWGFSGGNVQSDAGYPRSASQDWMYCQGAPTLSPPAPRHGTGQDKGMCICHGSAGKLAPLSAWILALIWVLC